MFPKKKKLLDLLVSDRTQHSPQQNKTKILNIHWVPKENRHEYITASSVEVLGWEVRGRFPSLQLVVKNYCSIFYYFNCNNFTATEFYFEIHARISMFLVNFWLELRATWDNEADNLATTKLLARQMSSI